MQTIIPHLWFDKEAVEASEFYTTVFPQSSVTHTITLKDTPSGDCDLVSFTLWNKEFMAISAGPLFKFNPSVSFIVNYDLLFFADAPDQEKAAEDALNSAWEKLADGGKVLMPLDKYPFSKRYGWIQDKYGVSWQLMLTDPAGEPRPSIIPSFLFTGDKAGKAEEAIKFYCSVFRNAQQGNINRYGPGMEPDAEQHVAFADFKLEDTWLAAMDSAREHGYGFNEAISLMVNCPDQATIDYYWEKLSAVPEAEQCGWIKDKYGISWQINSIEMEDIMRSAPQAKVNRIMQAMMSMKKLDVATLKAAATQAG